ncbi:hypothetical protein J1N10_18275 [Carboxylicivirga sp. A043]|uniref:hypothetical protein n=1 Tax=Carboxylicivirga litoralis TaxID=2816963 RepID=UPI0021CAF97D|nr:hypothetical protein [Carboxylicivirga sp. A043]MCU4157926.1 hypothetical protein [Carboxylicivirga sp. A043]
MLDRKEQIIEYVLGEWNDTFKTLASEICQNPNDVKLLLELNEHPDQKIAWRTAYLLDLAHDIKSNILEEYLELIMDRTPKLSNQSIKRHYLRILSQHDLSEIADGQLLDCCFEWLQTEDTPIAVKAHCMQIIYDLTIPYPELIPELKAVLENLLPYGSKGEVNRAKKILKLIEEKNK